MSGRTLREQAESLAPQLVAWRRELHQHPELGFEERKTAAFVESRLRDLEIEVRGGIARTGVVGILRTTANQPRPAILLRADMDALPIQEVEGREYGSKVPGKMHACGHDGHTAMLLGAATVLASRRDELPADVLLCFQPAEEGEGGAREMIREGVLELAEVGSAYAIHLWSQFPAGTVHVRPGPAMAASDEFTGRFLGRGGHGALPHKTIDPIVAGAQAVTALQSVISRSVDPVEHAVVTVGAFQAGSASNVIPDEARIEGTMRSFSNEVRHLLRSRVREVLQGAAAAGGCRLEFELREGYPAVINDPGAVEQVRRVARELFGDEDVHEPPAMAASEDFSHFLDKVPGAFVFLGAGNEARGIIAPHHSPEFDIDESALPQGAALLAGLALTA